MESTRGQCGALVAFCVLASLCCLAAGSEFPGAPKVFLPGVQVNQYAAVGTFNIPSMKTCVSARLFKNDGKNLGRLDIGFPDEKFSLMIFTNSTHVTVVSKENTTMVCTSQPGNYSSTLGFMPNTTWVSNANISGVAVAQYLSANPTRLWYYNTSNVANNNTVLRGWHQYWPETQQTDLGRVWFTTVNTTVPAAKDAFWSPEKYCGQTVKAATTIIDTDGPQTKPRPSRQCPVNVGCVSAWVPGYWRFNCFGCADTWIPGFYQSQCFQPVVWFPPVVWVPTWNWWCGK